MRRVYPAKTCPQCGLLFKIPDQRQKYCCMKCRRNAYKGNGNPNFRNGSRASAGYKVVHVTGDGKHSLEHRLVLENKIGRKLLPGEQVHHIDEDKTNNHPDNLEALTPQEHKVKHRAANTDTHKQCRKCRVMKPKSDFHNDKQRYDGLKTRCKECLNEEWRERYKSRK